MSKQPKDNDLRAALVAILTERGPDKSICPSEVPRRIVGETGNWRSHLKRTRELAIEMARQNVIQITKKGKPVALDQVRGVIRLRQGTQFQTDAGEQS